jgi:predicted nucleic acid-binding protein
MIAASALHSGCDTLWTEDMQHGMVLEEGLRIVNPFGGISETLRPLVSITLR